VANKVFMIDHENVSHVLAQAFVIFSSNQAPIPDLIDNFVVRHIRLVGNSFRCLNKQVRVSATTSYI